MIPAFFFKTWRSAANILTPYQELPKSIRLLFLARIINNLGSFISPLLTLLLTQKLGLSIAAAGTIISINVLLQAPSLMIGGTLADKWGRKKVIVPFQLLGGLVYFLCAFLPPNNLMIACFLVASNLFAISAPAYDALVADLTQPSERKTAFSLLYMGVNLGYAIAPVIAGVLFRDYVALVFLGNSVATMLSAVLILLLIKEPGIHIAPVNDLPKENKDFDHERERLIPALLQMPVLIYFALIMIIYSLVYSQWGYAVPFQFGQSFGDFGAKYYGVASGINGMTVILLTPFITYLTQRLSHLKSIAVGGFYYAIGFGAFGVASELWCFLLLVFIMTLGEIIVTVNSRTFIANYSPVTHRGRISSVLPLISGAGFTMGPFFMGMMIHHWGLKICWSLMGVLSLGGALLMVCLNGVEERRTDEV